MIKLTGKSVVGYGYSWSNSRRSGSAILDAGGNSASKCFELNGKDKIQNAQNYAWMAVASLSRTVTMNFANGVRTI